MRNRSPPPDETQLRSHPFTVDCRPSPCTLVELPARWYGSRRSTVCRRGPLSYREMETDPGARGGCSE
jgi:hypothetical protein